jgi:hypothetical protein
VPTCVRALVEFCPANKLPEPSATTRPTTANGDEPLRSPSNCPIEVLLTTGVAGLALTEPDPMFRDAPVPGGVAGTPANANLDATNA